ncbi:MULTISPECIES: hypothetical protein [unclassified Pseudomonas]|uniref:hypothetical protein n=1 Tax=unclassified Pseudomonas TaxID=196821 RepID=UPI002AC94068|nr:MULTISPECIES: hypothetical protein [unclassified Pseudomonas]MEB0048788.1 hypothetical protein [Pseudomonas sp. Dout3]MEB0099611.1 hypothetical protein [Pseudomonas sp. DC1.2]WPX56617.1 hypothetical protein RHM68_13115 [Pseudomonas sp. DC1.2]
MSGEREFKFRGQAWIVVWLLFMLSVHIILGGIWITRSFNTGGGIYLLISLPFTVFVGGLILRGRSDIVIDEYCISRRLFGRVWQKFEWSNIELVTEFSIPNQYSKTAIRGINIFPKVKPKYRMTPSGKMGFTDQSENKSELIRLINVYAQKNNITTELSTRKST